jgi:thioesterase domain-containing protein
LHGGAEGDIGADLAPAILQGWHQALVCTKAGSGPDPLVFLPGLVPTGPNLTDMMAQGPQDLNCYLMQRPVAAALATPRSFADHTRCYARVLDHSYPEAKLHLTGFSYGGAEAFETARQLAALGSAPASLTVIDHGPVFRRQWPVDPTWGGEAIRAEKRRRAHVFYTLGGLGCRSAGLGYGERVH